MKQPSSFLGRLRFLLAQGLTNQGLDSRTLKHTMSRQRTRRDSFKRRNLELLQQYGDNLPRKVRRRIAWDTVSANEAKQ